MSANNGEKKDLSLARSIASTISGGDLILQATYRPIKKKFENVSMEKLLKKHFNWESHASWRSEVLAPVYNRRVEQLFIDTWNALCSIPAFREEIVEIRKQLSRRGVNLDQIATQVCENWKIAKGNEWITWLIKNWDPTRAKHPPLTSSSPPDSFPPWSIELSYMKDKDTGAEVCRSATMILNAGVSRREAERIAAFAQKQLNPSKLKKGRPGLTDLERARLRSEISKLGVPKKRHRTASILKAQEALAQSNFRHLSVATIANEYRRWLREQNQPVKRYVRET